MDKWERREAKYNKRRYGMRVSGRSLKSTILPVIAKKAQQPKEKKNHGRTGRS